jgi:hypothetical protein
MFGNLVIFCESCLDLVHQLFVEGFHVLEVSINFQEDIIQKREYFRFVIELVQTAYLLYRITDNPFIHLGLFFSDQ